MAAARLGVPITHAGVEGLTRLPAFADIDLVFDATSATAHVHNDATLRAPNVNLVTCGGQATVPMVAAVSRVAQVHYAEIVASIASRSAGLGTRTNIDEFTETTAHALEPVGGAARCKAIIVLNPAESPLMMRGTVYTLVEAVDEDAVQRSVEKMAESVRQYVPGLPAGRTDAT